MSTLIECWRTDGRIMAGAERVSAEGVAGAAVTVVIVVSNPSLYGGAQCGQPM